MTSSSDFRPAQADLPSGTYEPRTAALPADASELAVAAAPLNLAAMGNHDLIGMTVNERLFACGLLEAFDQAAKRRDREMMIALLSKIEVGFETADAIMRNPKQYGY